MGKFLLIAATVLVSATAQAGVTRGLTLASNDGPAAVVEQPQGVEGQKPAALSSAVRQPAAVPATEATKLDQARPEADKSAMAVKIKKPRRKHWTTESRVIYELHRHGIYW
jgi:hypothetical protein